MGDNRMIFFVVEMIKMVYIIKFNVVFDFKFVVYEVVEFFFCVFVVCFIFKVGKDKIIFY